MTRDMNLRRRAVYTGLKPYLPAETLPEVLDHWERHYSDAPRFKLQGFVAEICQRADIKERRGDILLSLVQAMNMSAESLLREPDMDPAPRAGERASPDEVRVFQMLFEAISGQLDSTGARQLRLDLLASLRRRETPAAMLDQIQGWLGEEHELRAGVLSLALLQAMTNRAWILITQYLGPVSADRILHQASHRVTQQHPSLQHVIGALL